MSKKPLRILLVFNSHLETIEELSHTIQNYNQQILDYKQRTNRELEYYLLYVQAQIPGIALQSPDLIHFSIKETERSENILRNVGRILGIDSSKQIFAHGHSDVQAWRAAKKLKIHKVFGFSCSFNYLLQLQHFWERHAAMLTGSKKTRTA